jgi:hypothetical protein
MAMLERANGELVASEWTSTISVAADVAKRLPPSGQVARVMISPFEVDGHTMRYEWHGTVAAQAPFPSRQRSR